jgi:hypothetical protein
MADVRRGMDATLGSLMPQDLAAERGAVLHRALRELPVGLLKPLLAGIRRHADSLVPGSLQRGNGGCAVAMMLRELEADVPRRRRRRSMTIWDERPKLARRHPRLGHIEVIFDRTCLALLERHHFSEAEAGRIVGLWMAAETQAEIVLRHVEVRNSGEDASDPASGLDPALFADTVSRLRELRPWLSPDQAAQTVRAWVGFDEPMFVPREWEDEVELQRRRLAEVSEAVPG